MLIFLIGLFCFLLVIGFFITKGKSPLSFAVGSMIVLAALAFVAFIGMVIYLLLTAH